MAAYLSQRGKQLQALAICINLVLNTAVDRHTKAIYKTERKKCFLHLSEPEVTQMFKYS